MKRIAATVILMLCLKGIAAAQLKAGGVDMDLLLQKAASVGWIDAADKYIYHKLVADYAQCYYPVSDSIETQNNIRCCFCPPFSEQEKEQRSAKMTRQYQSMWGCGEKFQKAMTQMADSFRKVIIAWCMDKIKPIAQANGYDLVFDLCREPTLPLPPCNDITDLVLKKLDW